MLFLVTDPLQYTDIRNNEMRHSNIAYIMFQISVSRLDLLVFC